MLLCCSFRLSMDDSGKTFARRSELRRASFVLRHERNDDLAQSPLSQPPRQIPSRRTTRKCNQTSIICKNAQVLRVRGVH